MRIITTKDVAIKSIKAQGLVMPKKKGNLEKEAKLELWILDNLLFSNDCSIFKKYCIVLLLYKNKIVLFFYKKQNPGFKFVLNKSNLTSGGYCILGNKPLIPRRALRAPPINYYED